MRSNSSGRVYVHQDVDMRKTNPMDDRAFTVVMPAVLRDRFERWLRDEHLQMIVQQEAGPLVYRVANADR